MHFLLFIDLSLRSCRRCNTRRRDAANMFLMNDSVVLQSRCLAVCLISTSAYTRCLLKAIDTTTPCDHSYLSLRTYTVIHYRPATLQTTRCRVHVRCHKEIDDFCKVLFASHFVVQLRQQSSRCKLYTILLLLVSFCVCVY